mgnify:CR=1 FL=1
MIEITPTFIFDETEVTYTFVRAAGPGGQNVNKVATSMRLRLDLFQALLGVVVSDTQFEGQPKSLVLKSVECTGSALILLNVNIQNFLLREWMSIKLASKSRNCWDMLELM